MYDLDFKLAVVERHLTTGESARATARAMGVCCKSVQRWVRGEHMNERRPKPPPADRVDNLQLREAFLCSGLTGGEVARRIGWRRMHKGKRISDSTRVLRLLGLLPEAGAGNGRRRRRITYRNAEKLARAIGVDPVDVGL